MYDKILAPLDGSGLATGSAPHVQAIAATHRSEIILLQGFPAIGVLTMATAKEQEEAEEQLVEEQALLNEGISARHGTSPGSDSVAERVPYGEVHDVDSIAMTTHGRSGVSRWVLGSVASKVLRGTSKPILLIRSPGAPISAT